MKESIAKDKYKTTMLLQPEEKMDNKLIAILSGLFWRKPELAEPALKFLELLKKENGIEDNRWEKICKEIGITRGQYDSITRKLRGSGFVYKRDSTWMFSNSFEKFLGKVAQIVDDWKKQ